MTTTQANASIFILAWTFGDPQSREDDTAEDICRVAIAVSFDLEVLKRRATDDLNDEREDLGLDPLEPGGLTWTGGGDGWTAYDEEADLCLVIAPRPVLA